MINYSRFITIAGCFLLAASSAQAGLTTFTPRLSVSEEYTDNRDLTHRDSQEEFTTVISPGIDYSAAAKNEKFDFSYTADFAKYHTSDQGNTWRHHASASFISKPSKHTVFIIQDNFLLTDEPYQSVDYTLVGNAESEGQLLPAVDTTLRTGRYSYLTNSANTNLTRQFGDKNFITLRGLFSLRKELKNVYKNDNQQYIPAIDVTYWPTTHLGFSTSAIYTLGVFPNAVNYDDWQGIFTPRWQLTRHLELFAEGNFIARRYKKDIGNDYDNYAGSTGIFYKSDKDLSFRLGCGYFIQDLKTRKNVQGAYVNSTIDKKWSYALWTANLTAAAGLDRNETGTENLGLERYYTLIGSAGYNLTKHLQASMNGAARINEYLNTANDQTDYRGNFSCGLSYTPRQRLLINARYAHNLLRGRGNGNFDENVAYLTVSIAPQGIRLGQ